MSTMDAIFFQLSNDVFATLLILQRDFSVVESLAILDPTQFTEGKTDEDRGLRIMSEVAHGQKKTVCFQ
jgi:hypothetical protein